MANLYVEEYASLITDRTGHLLPIPGNPLNNQKIAIASAANVGTATNEFVKFVVLTADTACQYQIGDNPTATAKSRFLPANVPRYIAIKGDMKISVVQQK